MYCGKLAKKANVGVLVGNCVQNLMRMYLPLVAGGGLCSIKGNITSFNLEVLIRAFLSSETLMAISRAFKRRCLVSAEINKMGTSVNGAIFSRIANS